jgi:NitT/TauT family transport system substrate-binding protein
MTAGVARTQSIECGILSRAQCEKLKRSGKTLKAEVIQKAISRIEFTWDPICASLKKSAEAAQSVGFTRKAPALGGIYALNLLNNVLKEKNLPLIQELTP